MTTKLNYDPYNDSIIPSVDLGSVENGQVSDAIKQYWMKTGLINPDGTANKPENVVAVEQGQWNIKVNPGYPAQNVPPGDQYLVPDYSSGGFPKLTDYAFQPTDLLLKMKDGSGTIFVEALFYKVNGVDHVSPVLFFVPQSLITKPMENYIFQSFGHPKEGSAYKIGTPYVGVEPGQVGWPYISQLTDKIAYLSDPSESARENFAAQVVKSQDPSGIDRFLWAVSVSGG